MKKLVIVLSLFPMLVFGQKGNRKFTELNIEVAAIDSYDFGDGFPGASILQGQTFEFPKNKVVEYQLGIVFPTFGTAKFSGGLGNLDKNIMVACRPWPLAHKLNLDGLQPVLRLDLTMILFLTSLKSKINKYKSSLYF